MPNASEAVRLVAASLQRERTRLGWSMAELARNAGIAKSTLSQLESATGNPSVETLWALATAMGIPFSRLLEDEQTEVRVVRAGEGPGFATEAGGYLVTLLSTAEPGTRRDLYRLDVAKGASRESAPHLSGTVEHVLVCSGSALVGPSDDPVELRAGDFITYRGDLDHVFTATADGTRAVLVSEHG